MQCDYWDKLSAITDELVAEFGSRPDAFDAACRRNPELAARAIDPTGKPLRAGAESDVTPSDEKAPLLRAVDRLIAEQQRGAE